MQAHGLVGYRSQGKFPKCSKTPCKICWIEYTAKYFWSVSKSRGSRVESKCRESRVKSRESRENVESRE